MRKDQSGTDQMAIIANIFTLCELNHGGLTVFSHLISILNELWKESYDAFEFNLDNSKSWVDIAKNYLEHQLFTENDYEMIV